MEQTLSGVVAEVEQLVKPLGFKIDTVERREKGFFAVSSEKIDNDELKISIARKGCLG
jgi:hypothetical protein